MSIYADIEGTGLDPKNKRLPDPTTTQAITTTVNVNTEAIASAVTAAKSELATLAQLKAAGGIQIQPTADVIKECLQDWCRQFDALEETRTSITKPMNAAKAKVDALFATGKAELQTLISAGKELLGSWAVLQAQRTRESLQLAADAAQAGDVAVLTGALNIVNATPAPSKGVSTKAYWTARVLDVLALPMRFQKTVADDAAIAAYVGKYDAHQVPDPVKGIVFELQGGVTQVRR